MIVASDTTGEYSETELSIDVLQSGEAIPGQTFHSDHTISRSTPLHKTSKQIPPLTPEDVTLNSPKVGARPPGMGQNRKGAKILHGIMDTPAR